MNVKMIFLAFAVVICQANGQYSQSSGDGSLRYPTFGISNFFSNFFRPSSWYQSQQQQQQPYGFQTPFNQFSSWFNRPQIQMPQIQPIQVPQIQVPQVPQYQVPYVPPSYISEELTSGEYAELPEGDIAQYESGEVNNQVPEIPQIEELPENQGHIEEFPGEFSNGQINENPVPQNVAENTESETMPEAPLFQGSAAQPGDYYDEVDPEVDMLAEQPEEDLRESEEEIVVPMQQAPLIATNSAEPALVADIPQEQQVPTSTGIAQEPAIVADIPQEQQAPIIASDAEESGPEAPVLQEAPVLA